MASRDDVTFRLAPSGTTVTCSKRLAVKLGWVEPAPAKRPTKPDNKK